MIYIIDLVFALLWFGASIFTLVVATAGVELVNEGVEWANALNVLLGVLLICLGSTAFVVSLLKFGVHVVQFAV